MNKQIQTLKVSGHPLARLPFTQSFNVYFRFKKSLVKICKRTRKSNSNMPVSANTARSSSYTRSTSGASSSQVEYCYILTGQECKQSSSSGYTSATDIDSLANQQNYQDAVKRDDTHVHSEHLIQIKHKQIKSLLDNQTSFIDQINYGLENFIRPMSIIINAKLYGKLVQNFEKINAITAFIRNQIADSIKLTSDMYSSTINVLNEYVSSFWL